jgi:hypothetical protein
VGKTTLIRETFSPHTTFEVNLLLSDVFSKFRSRPEVFREEIEAKIRRPEPMG